MSVYLHAPHNDLPAFLSGLDTGIGLTKCTAKLRDALRTRDASSRRQDGWAVAGTIINAWNAWLKNPNKKLWHTYRRAKRGEPNKPFPEVH